jgi:cytochrome c556
MRILLVLLAGITFIGAGLMADGGALAQDANKAAQEKRTETMKRMGAAMGHISKVVKGEEQYDPATVAAAETVREISKIIPDLFPAGSAVGETRAKPNIWTDWDNFKKKASALVEPADILVPAVKTGQTETIGPALKAAGGACKGCHDDYQQPKT